MRFVGYAATAAIGVTAAVALVFVIWSLPDLARYRRLRKM